MPIRTVERAFAILHVLRDKSDESHPLTLSQIEGHLKAIGHEQARSSVVVGLQTLAGCGVDIKKREGSSPAAYYLDQRALSAADVEYISGALSASRYITAEQAKLITLRCGRTLSEYERVNVEAETQVRGRRTSNDVDWLYNVRMLSRAISNRHDISFVYVDFDQERISVPRRSGKRYLVSPLALIFADETYYLQATEDGVESDTFRVDHMRSIQHEEATINSSEAHAALDIEKLTERSFSMCPSSDGRDRRVELLVEQDCINSVIDYFKDRHSCNMICSDIDGLHMSASVTVQPSRAFYGWIAQHLGGVRISAPSDLKREFEVECAKLLESISS